MLWIHQGPCGGGDWPTAHLHLHLAPVLRGPGTIRHLASAELGAGVFFDPVDPLEAAAQIRGDTPAARTGWHDESAPQAHGSSSSSCRRRLTAVGKRVSWAASQDA